MNRYFMIALFGAVTATAQDQRPDGQVVALAEANRAKDIARIAKLARAVVSVPKDRTSEQKDLMAAGLAKSMGICKRDYDALETIIDALKALRSKKGIAALKRIALRKKANGDRAAAIQARALVALGAVEDPRQLGGIEDQAKNRNSTIAKGAYASLAYYRNSAAKTRRRAAEILMKRLMAEYPRYSPGKRVSPEKRARWRKVSSTIIGSLQAVCRQPTIRSVDDWEAWWKENKRRARTWSDSTK